MTCFRLNARSWRTRRAARSDAPITAALRRRGSSGSRLSGRSKLAVTHDDHQQVVEVVGDAPGGAAPPPPSSRLAELLSRRRRSSSACCLSVTSRNITAIFPRRGLEGVDLVEAPEPIVAIRDLARPRAALRADSTVDRRNSSRRGRGTPPRSSGRGGGPPECEDPVAARFQPVRTRRSGTRGCRGACPWARSRRSTGSGPPTRRSAPRRPGAPGPPCGGRRSRAAAPPSRRAPCHHAEEAGQEDAHGEPRPRRPRVRQPAPRVGERDGDAGGGDERAHRRAPRVPKRRAAARANTA